eukprot:scaffold1495_cov248-Pinguiococcus_pyrenoidosus.AAC.7
MQASRRSKEAHHRVEVFLQAVFCSGKPATSFLPVLRESSEPAPQEDVVGRRFLGEAPLAGFVSVTAAQRRDPKKLCGHGS